jgi:hypothetical protein
MIDEFFLVRIVSIPFDFHREEGDSHDPAGISPCRWR